MMTDIADAPPGASAGQDAVWAGGKPASAEWLARWRAEPLHEFLA